MNQFKKGKIEADVLDNDITRYQLRSQTLKIAQKSLDKFSIYLKPLHYRNNRKPFFSHLFIVKLLFR